MKIELQISKQKIAVKYKQDIFLSVGYFFVCQEFKKRTNIIFLQQKKVFKL